MKKRKERKNVFALFEAHYAFKVTVRDALWKENSIINCYIHYRPKVCVHRGFSTKSIIAIKNLLNLFGCSLNVQDKSFPTRYRTLNSVRCLLIYEHFNFSKNGSKFTKIRRVENFVFQNKNSKYFSCFSTP